MSVSIITQWQNYQIELSQVKSNRFSLHSRSKRFNSMHYTQTTIHTNIEQGSDLPIYIWYESYPEHIEEGYKGRVSRVSQDSPFGSASLNLTSIRESDQGWYECKVVFLNRDPKQHKNGTWFHLDVHAPPRFSVTPEDIIYVNLGKFH